MKTLYIRAKENGNHGHEFEFRLIAKNPKQAKLFYRRRMAKLGYNLKSYSITCSTAPYLPWCQPKNELELYLEDCFGGQ